MSYTLPGLFIFTIGLSSVMYGSGIVFEQDWGTLQKVLAVFTVVLLTDMICIRLIRKNSDMDLLDVTTTGIILGIITLTLGIYGIVLSLKHHSWSDFTYISAIPIVAFYTAIIANKVL